MTGLWSIVMMGSGAGGVLQNHRDPSQS